MSVRLLEIPLTARFVLECFDGVLEHLPVGAIFGVGVFVPRFREVVVWHRSGRRDQFLPGVWADIGKLEERRHGTLGAVVGDVGFKIRLFVEDDVDRVAKARHVTERVGGVDHVCGHLAVGIPGHASVL
jgi:hypothetical protein